MNEEENQIVEESVFHQLDAMVNVKGTGCWDDLSMTERRDTLETILWTGELIDLDDALCDVIGSDIRKVMCYYMISKKKFSDSGFF